MKVDFPCPFCPTKAILLPRSTKMKYLLKWFYHRNFVTELYNNSSWFFETGKEIFITELSSSSTQSVLLLSNF
jgi:hypothetical protein